MKKKVFTVLLLAVFMLAQFSFASAAAVAGDVTLAALPTFSANGDTVDLDWTVSGMPAAGTQRVNIWTRVVGDPAWVTCISSTVVTGLSSANGTYAYGLAGYSDQDVVEFTVVVATLNCSLADAPADGDAGLASTFIDGDYVSGFWASPPDFNGDSDETVACNTFEMWALVSDARNSGPSEGYSGFYSWNQSITGTFAPPAPEGPANELLSWVYTFPATASGDWMFEIDPEDMVGNTWGGETFYDNSLMGGIQDYEKEDCVDFTDTAGNANEVYIRYLGTLELLAGNPDGSFGPDNTLTRAEAAVLFEQANGYDAAGLPVAAPSAACTFTDVSASDWFAGWVWQACADGFMNGVGGGLFDPSNTLTRGQIVTIFNNIVNMMDGGWSGYDYFDTAYSSTLEYQWDHLNPELRFASWVDVAIGAYYAAGVVESYAVGISEGTDATHFSPDQPINRGEFAKWLYRAISYVSSDYH